MVKTQIENGPRIDNAGIITLSLAKKNAKIDYSEEDDLLQLYLDGISDEIEAFTGRIFLQRRVKVFLSKFDTKVQIPVRGRIEIDSISFLDENDAEQFLQPQDFKLYSYENGNINRVLFGISDFPELSKKEEYPITINLIAGYPENEMPADVKHAALLMFNNAEAYREDMPIHLNRSAQAKLRPHKLY